MKLAGQGRSAYVSRVLDRTDYAHRPDRQPILNVPVVITALAVIMIVIHVVRALVSTEMDIDILSLFAFVPIRYDYVALRGETFPGGMAADIWTFVTYAFLHGNVTHIAVNLVWMLAFGSPVARRFGTVRFLLFFAVTAVAGAAAHLATHFGAIEAMVGASASISGAMAAAIRFVFSAGGPLGGLRGDDPRAYLMPAKPLSVVFRDRRILGFVGVWFGLNILFGAGVSTGLGDAPVAWQAHIGGFVAGLLLFPLFDPVPRATERRA